MFKSVDTEAEIIVHKRYHCSWREQENISITTAELVVLSGVSRKGRPEQSRGGGVHAVGKRGVREVGDPFFLFLENLAVTSHFLANKKAAHQIPAI